MKKSIIDDLPLCNEMMEDLSNKYQVDTFWKNYQSMNVTLIKHYGLKSLGNAPIATVVYLQKNRLSLKEFYYIKLLINYYVD